MTWPSRLRPSIAALAFTALAGCVESPLEPLPPVSDPSALRVGEPLYVCGRWATGTPPAAPTALTVDVHFGPDTSFRGPSEAQLAALAARGAAVSYRFSFPAARVAIDPARIPGLVDSGPANAVVTVPDPGRYDWRFILAIDGGLDGADSLYVVRLGGRVVSMLYALDFIIAELPDAAAPYLRRWPRLRFAENDAFGCLGGAAERSRRGAPTGEVQG